MVVGAQIDAETGEIIKIHKPWWAFLAKENNADDNEIREDVEGNETENFKKVAICHIPRGNPDARHSISVGEPAVRAHLAHGDILGPCSMEGNITNPENNNGNPQNNTHNENNTSESLVRITLLRPEQKESFANNTEIPLQFIISKRLFLFWP